MFSTHCGNYFSLNYLKSKANGIHGIIRDVLYVRAPTRTYVFSESKTVQFSKKCAQCEVFFQQKILIPSGDNIAISLTSEEEAIAAPHIIRRSRRKLTLLLQRGQEI